MRKLELAHWEILHAGHASQALCRRCTLFRTRSARAHAQRALHRARLYVCTPRSPMLDACAQQVRTFLEQDGRVVNPATATDVKTGRTYTQALLDELELGPFDAWIEKISALATDSEMRTALNPIFVHLHTKVQAGEQWTNLPSSAPGGSCRDIAAKAPKVIGMAIRRAIDAARHTATGEQLKDGFFHDSFSSFRGATELLAKRLAEKQAAHGKEASGRRDKELYDHELMTLFESILSNAVAKDQAQRGVTQRHPTDTLILGVVVALLRALGQRCLNVRFPRRRPLSSPRPGRPPPSSTLGTASYDARRPMRAGR